MVSQIWPVRTSVSVKDSFGLRAARRVRTGVQQWEKEQRVPASKNSRCNVSFSEIIALRYICSKQWGKNPLVYSEDKELCEKRMFCSTVNLWFGYYSWLSYRHFFRVDKR